MGGLSAAQKLSGAFSKVGILEARNRYGGRVLTENIQDQVTLEYGANWIHSLKNHFLEDVVHKEGVEVVKSRFANEDVIQTSPYEKNPKAVEAVYREGQRVNKLIRKYQDQGSRDVSFQTGINRAVRALKPKYLSKPTYQNLWMQTTFASDYAMDSTKMSLWWFDATKYPADFDYLIKDKEGMTGLFEKRFASVLDKIVYGVEVKEINNAGNLINVVDAKGKTYTAKFVISTIPLGVMQNPETRPIFRPPLGPEYMRALNMRDPGRNEKVFVCFNEKDLYNEDLEAIYNFDKESKSNIFTFVNLNYYQDLPQDLHCLLGFVENIYVAKFSQMSDATVKNEVVAQMNRMFPGKNLTPRFFRRSNWFGDKFTQGAWSYNRVGIKPKVAFKGIEKHPKVPQRIFFAGEHTDRVMWGSMNGAFQSGIRAASQVLKFKNGCASPGLQRSRKKCLKFGGCTYSKRKCRAL